MNAMRFTLVNINKLHSSEVVAPLGLCFIASYLKKYGGFGDTTIVDPNTENIYAAIKKNKPDIVGVSSVTQNFEEAKKFVDFVKRELGVPVILGGVHISILPTSCPKNVDVGVLGEGEETVLELMQLFERDKKFSAETLRGIKGICYYDNGELRINERRPPIPTDKLTHPDRSLLNMKFYLRKSNIVPFHLESSLHIMTSRGCPYRCVFCSTSAFWHSYREFSVDWVMDEILSLVREYESVRVIHIFDDLFLANKKRAFEIVDRIKKEKLNERIKFMVLGRANLLDDDTMAKLKEMNVVCIGFGMESGSDKVLKYLKANTVTVAQNKGAIEYCKKYKIIAFGTFMIGNPGEGVEDLKQTYSLVAESKGNPYFAASVYITTPLPGTVMWEEAKKKGIVNDKIDWDDLCMDLPNDINKLKKAPLMTDLDVETFFSCVQRFNQLGEEIFLQNRFFILSPMLIRKALSKPRKTIRFSIALLKGKVKQVFPKNN